MSQRFSLGEIFGGAIWLASGVAVAGYTFDAFKSAYTPFPGPGGGSGSGFGGAAIPFNSEETGRKAAHSVVKKIPLVGTPLANASNWLQNLFSGSGLGQGPSSLSDKEIARLQQLPAPPKEITQALVKAKNNKPALTKAANDFAAWARAHKWKPADANAFLRYVGVKVF